jgi:hypothetical protein
MLGRKTYTRDEFDQAKAAITGQLKAYATLAGAAEGSPKGKTALAAFEPLFFNNLTLALDRFFVHRVRPVTGKDGNPLNEVEMIAEALMNNDGVFAASKVIKLTPEKSVAKLAFGEPIRLTADQFERLSAAFLAEIESRFL